MRGRPRRLICSGCVNKLLREYRLRRPACRIAFACWLLMRSKDLEGPSTPLGSDQCPLSVELWSFPSDPARGGMNARSEVRASCLYLESLLVLRLQWCCKLNRAVLPAAVRPSKRRARPDGVASGNTSGKRHVKGRLALHDLPACFTSSSAPSSVGPPETRLTSPGCRMHGRTVP